MSKFDEFIQRVLTNEGGYTDGPGDPGNWTGGRVGIGNRLGTKYGISAASYPSLDIKNLTRSDAINIYRRDFWNKIDGDLLPDAVGYSVLDGAVNSGPKRAMVWLQKAAEVTPDGDWGPITNKAVHMADPNDLVMRFNAYRLRFMTSCSNWLHDGAGWANRIAQNLLYGAEDN